MKICVYGAASPTIDPEYIRQVEIMGEEMAKRGHSLVFGGGANGLMGAAARGVNEKGGHIIGIAPEFFNDMLFNSLKVFITHAQAAFAHRKMFRLFSYMNTLFCNGQLKFI